jgi:ribosomal subunit interface protein
MSLRIAGKHMDIGEAFRGRIESRVGELVGKYFGGRFSGNVTVLKSGTRFSADCLVHLDSGMTLQAAGDAQDATAAFELASDRLETRLRRYKRRLKAHPVGGGNDSVDISYTVMAPVGDDEEEVADDYAPAVVAETSMALKTMTVASAVVELDTKDSPVFVFRNAGNQEINIVYRRPDGNIGWIDPSSTKVVRA